MTDQRSRLAAWLSGDGIEIGALHHPLPVRPGTTVTYVDWKDEVGIREHYPELKRWSLAPVSVVATAVVHTEMSGPASGVRGIGGADAERRVAPLHAQ